MIQTVVVKNRIQSIDILRGVVMIVMALDHVRDYFHHDAWLHDPLDPATTTLPLYITRWITNFCAPVFVFLAGASAYLGGLRKTKGQLSRFLVTRGLWPVLVEIVIVTLGWTFNPLYNLIFLQVIWAIGISMVLLGLLVRLPYLAILAIGLCIVVGHNLLDYPEIQNNYQMGVLWDLVHSSRWTRYSYAPDHFLLIAYSFLPWTGIMLLGYGAGKLFAPHILPQGRRKKLLYTGAGLIALFVLLRSFNSYGDPVPWQEQETDLAGFFSFMNVNKYPPSLMYACITLGPALIILGLIDKMHNRFARFATVFGRVPFFYYVLHIYLIHTLTVITFYVSGYGAKDIVSPDVPFFFRPTAFGFDLWVIYILWIVVVLLLFLPCQWFNRYKSTHHQWWLSYI